MNPLQLRIGCEMIFDVPRPTPMVLMLNVHPDRAADLITSDRIQTDPPAGNVREYLDAFGNRCVRLHAPAGTIRVWTDAIINDDGQVDAHDLTAKQHPVEDLPSDALQYLLGSRYCEVDRLSATAWDLFGKIQPGWARVQAVCDWVHENVEFGYKYARGNRTAQDTFTERKGVCRDFMHLAITFCRALNIPARYATGYLGDIDCAPDPTPMDYSAYFEAYLSGRWWPLDPRHNVPRIGRICVARGRDAVDVALSTTYGATKLMKFTVITDEVKAMPADLRKTG